MRFPGSVAPVATQLEDGRLLADGTDLHARLPQVTGLRAAYQWCCFRPGA